MPSRGASSHDPAPRAALLALEAAAWLGLAGLAVRILPFARIAEWLGGPRPRRADRTPLAATRVGWAIDAATSRAPWRVRCFERGLAAHAMLTRRGQESTLYYGANGAREAGPTAHVWVRSAGLDVVGGDEAPDFVVLARFS